MNQNLASDSAKSKAEEGLLYTAFQRLKVPLNYYAEARSLLVNLKTALGYQKVVRVCSAIIQVLKRYNLLNHPQYCPYQIAKEMHISAFGAL